MKKKYHSKNFNSTSNWFE